MNIKYITTIVLLLATLVYLSCTPNPADARLGQIEIIISKWENELRARPVEFDDLVSIQKDITIFDLDPGVFAASYGTLSNEQERRIKDFRIRFKKLLRKEN